DQQAHYLPRIRSGKDLWCQLFSEPDAGSDLASLRTRAELQGDHYVVNGQKVWTTNGQWAGLGLLLARTDREAPKHRGISAFVVDMAAPGVSVRPLREITGTSDFNEVFLDDVRVPVDHLIGEPGQGWLIANTTLAHERTAVGASVVNLQDAWQRLWLQVSDPAVSGSSSVADVRRELAEVHVAIEALNHFAHDVLTRWQAGTEAPDDAAIAKLVFSELNLRLSELAVQTLGVAGAAVEGDLMEFDDGRWQDAWLYGRAYTIAGGSSEIMRSLIAERGLGLPR
ncbi:MAG: acyl-CoA dehydrogenase, partial [Aeromicrobium sp.]|nr:acyl-CoA dehydrogenase [Aeromicrobium sp.]